MRLTTAKENSPGWRRSSTSAPRGVPRHARLDLLRQPCFAQPTKVVIAVLCFFECHDPPRYPANRIVGLETHDLGRLCPSVFSATHLRVGRGQQDAARQEPRRPGDEVAYSRQ